MNLYIFYRPLKKYRYNRKHLKRNIMSRQKISFLLIIFSLSIVVQTADRYFPGSKWDSVSPESLNVNSKNVQTLISTLREWIFLAEIQYASAEIVHFVVVSGSDSRRIQRKNEIPTQSLPVVF